MEIGLPSNFSLKGNAVTDLIKIDIQNYCMKGSPKCIRTKSQIYRYLHYFVAGFVLFSVIIIHCLIKYGTTDASIPSVL